MKLYIHRYRGGSCSFSVSPETGGLSPLYDGTQEAVLSSEWTKIPYERGDQAASAYARTGPDGPEVYAVAGNDTLHIECGELIHTHRGGQSIVRRGNEDIEGLVTGVLKQLLELDGTPDEALVDKAFIEMAIRLRPEFESQIEEFTRAVSIMHYTPGKAYQAHVLRSLVGVKAEDPVKEAEKALLEAGQYSINTGEEEVSGTELALAGFLEIWNDFQKVRFSTLSDDIVRVDDKNLKALIKRLGL